VADYQGSRHQRGMIFGPHTPCLVVAELSDPYSREWLKLPDKIRIKPRAHIF
jgi:hypothetical protein